MSAARTTGHDVEELLQFLYLMPVAVIRLNRAGRIDMLNPRAVQLLHDLEIPSVGADGTTILDGLSAGLAKHWTASIGRIGAVVPARRISPSRPGLPAMHLQLQVVRPDTRCTMLVIEDVTNAVEQEREALRQRLRLGVVLENIHGYCALMLDESGKVSEWNPSIGRLLGIQEGEVVGQPLLDQLAEDAQGLPNPPGFPEIERAVARQGWCRLLAPWKGANDQTVWGECIVTPVVEKSGIPSGYVTVIRDVTEEHHRNQCLLEAATQDPLTGIGNRRGFDQGVAALQDAAHGAPTVCSLVTVDIDHFKQVNDRFGHKAGDAVLKAVAQGLKSAARGRDILARFGGEEFVLLLPDTPLALAASIAERLRAKVESMIVEEQGHCIRVTASFGVSQKRPDESQVAALARADSALYEAKQGGRNRVALSGPEACCSATG